MKHQAILCTVLFLASQSALHAAPAVPKPNILLMVAEDLGYRDLGSYGATKIATPRIDSLARDGARFTDAHSFICRLSPPRSRARGKNKPSSPSRPPPPATTPAPVFTLPSLSSATAISPSTSLSSTASRSPFPSITIPSFSPTRLTLCNQLGAAL